MREREGGRGGERGRGGEEERERGRGREEGREGGGEGQRRRGGERENEVRMEVKKLVVERVSVTKGESEKYDRVRKGCLLCVWQLARDTE